MKNIKSYYIIFLIGILFVGNETFANEKPVFSNSKEEQKKKILIKELGYKLSKDIVFERVFDNLSALQLINEANYSGMTDDGKKNFTSKVDVLLANESMVTDEDFKSTSELMSFGNTSDAEAYIKNIVSSLMYLKVKYSNFYDLDEIALQQVNEIAIDEGNLMEKFSIKIAESKEDCFKRIKSKYDDCLTKGSWYGFAMRTVSIVCYVTMIACAIAAFAVLVSNAEVLVPYLTGIYESAVAAGEASVAAEGSALGYVRVTITAIKNASANISVSAFKALLNSGLRCVLGVFSYMCGERTISYFGGDLKNMNACYTVYKNSAVVCMGQDGVISGMGTVE